jgi:hypothetical protein
MNEYLNKFLTIVRDQKMKKTGSMSYKYGDNGLLKQTREQKLTYRNQEQDNYKKMIGNLQDEHSHKKQRLAKIQDPAYVLELKSEIKGTKDIIKGLTSKNRSLQHYQANKESKLEKVIKRGNNDAMNNISDLLRQLIVLQERNCKLDKEIEFQNKNEVDIDDETEKAIARLGLAESTARKIGIDSKRSTNNSITPIYPDRLINIQKKIQKHSIKTINRKFQMKI